jgi:hypothetical protein
MRRNGRGLKNMVTKIIRKTSTNIVTQPVTV